MSNTYKHPNLIYDIKKTIKKYKVEHLKNQVAQGEQIEEITDLKIAEAKRNKQNSNTAALAIVSNEDPRQTNAELQRCKEHNNS
jgi:acyl-ACP thioesterase